MLVLLAYTHWHIRYWRIFLLILILFVPEVATHNLILWLGPLESLEINVKVSAALVEIVQRINTRPRYILAKVPNNHVFLPPLFCLHAMCRLLPEGPSPITKECASYRNVIGFAI